MIIKALFRPDTASTVTRSTTPATLGLVCFPPSTDDSYPLVGSGNRVLKIVTEMSSSTISGGASPFGQNVASAVRDSREREKKEMRELNDRLASYIEQVRFLEAQNRKLAADLELLRGRWGKDTNTVKTIYEAELTVSLQFKLNTQRYF